MPTTASPCRRTASYDVTYGHHFGILNDAVIDILGDGQQEVLVRLAAQHRPKIDLADEVLVVNPDGYIGASTSKEIEYARQQGKPIRFTTAPE